MRRRLLLSAALLCGGSAFAQQEPEVRRAVPVGTPFSQETRPAIPVGTPFPSPAQATPTPDVYQNPAWMQRIPQAAPAQTPGPEPGFTPYRPVRPSSAPPANPTPISESSALAQVPPPPDAQSGDIRLSPSQAAASSEQADLDEANAVYSRKMYDYASTDYEKYLITYPQGAHRDMALFRLAECHRMLGNDDAARDAYARLLQEFQKGEFAGAGAYRLGEYLMAEKKYDPAQIQFRVAASQAASDEVRLSAKFNIAKCYEQMNQPGDAAKFYADVAAVEKNNPYRDYARMASAELSAKAGRKQDALAQYEKVAASQAASALRAEALVKGASLAAELGDKKKAVKMFGSVLDLDDAGDWRPIAILGAARLNYDLGDYQRVAALSEKPLGDLSKDTQAEILRLAGNSYRQLGNARAARAVYDRLLLQYPDSTSSQSARFDRLLSMYQLNDPKLADEADKFLADSKDPKERAQVTLLKAETLFKNQKYADAVPLYAQVMGSGLSDDIKTKALYKLGWSQAGSGDYEGAIKIYTAYIDRNPGGDTVASALVQRGLAYQQSKDYTQALRDFDGIVEKYPDRPERELALQQKALILGQQKDYEGMKAAFQQLLKDYPKSAGAGQANFWLGWAAFDAKDYKGAIDYLEAARKLDPAQYGDRAAVRILLCQYYLENRDAVLKLIAQNKKMAVPPEIRLWLGRKSFEDGDYEGAERQLLPVVQGAPNPDPDVLIELAEAEVRLGKNKEAGPIIDKYLATARDPYSRARGVIAKGRVALAEREFDAASRSAEEALLLQPEGKLNAEARLLTAEIAFGRGSYDEAAKAFMSVALLYDDPDITPRALRRAADAYKKTDNLKEAEKALQELQQRFPDVKKTPKLSKDSA